MGKRQFGRYTELLLMSRLTYENRNQCVLEWDEDVERGKPEVGYSQGLRSIRIHPQDYIHLLLGNDSYLTHVVTMDWLSWKLDRMESDAIARIEDMYEEQPPFYSMFQDTYEPGLRKVNYLRASMGYPTYQPTQTLVLKGE